MSATWTPAAPHLPIAAQLAACETAVGMALRDDVAIVELLGRPVDIQRIARLLLGDRRPRTGATTGAGPLWWHRRAPHRALVVGAPGRGGEVRAALRAATRELPDVVIADACARHTAIALAGPRAAATAAAAPDAIVAVDGAQRAIVVVRAADAPAAWRALRETSRPFAVEPAAIDLHWVGRRVTGCQRPAPAFA